MGHFKFQWNQNEVKVDFDGNMQEFANNLGSYLISAKSSEIKSDREEAKGIYIALSTALYAYKTVDK